MGEIFRFHGMTVGVILTNMDPEERRNNYNCDVTYGTNNEFGFDYLRDNMSLGKNTRCSAFITMLSLMKSILFL